MARCLWQCLAGMDEHTSSHSCSHVKFVLWWGGLDIAFHDAGFQIIKMVEIDARFVETLGINAQEGRRLAGAEPLCMDIKDFDPADDLHIDFIIGGPPCQTFSAAGRRAAGVADLMTREVCYFKSMYAS